MTVLAGFPFFWLLDTGNLAAMVVTVSVGFQLGALVAGAPTPFLAAALLAAAGGASWPVALMLVVSGVVTLVCALAVRDTFRDTLQQPAAVGTRADP